MSRNVSEEGFEARDEAAARPGVARIVLRVAGLVLTACVLLVVGFMLARTVLFRAPASVTASLSRPLVATATADSASQTAFPASSTASIGVGRVEVPDLRGIRVDEAVVLLHTAGFGVLVRDVGPEVESEASRTVASQDPPAGTVTSNQSTVSVSAPPLSAAVVLGATEVTRSADASGYVVCIDPGHQAHSDTGVEPLGPGSKTVVPRATGGATGVSTGVPEYETNLELSMNLKRRLEAAGMTVVLTRTTNDVTLSNAQRAAIANRARAVLFVRVHCAASPNPTESGATTLFAAGNDWTKPYLKQSAAAARIIEDALCRRSGAANLGTQSQEGLAGFNWAKQPSVLVETGFLSNPVEDRLLASPNYQDRVAEGLAEGILEFLNGRRR